MQSKHFFWLIINAYFQIEIMFGQNYNILKRMSISESIEGKKRIQESFLEFLEEESNLEENYENFVQVINTH